MCVVFMLVCVPVCAGVYLPVCVRYVCMPAHVCDVCVCASSVSLEIKPGRLVAVVGAVGSGKSSLMSALLGEMHSIKGFVNIQVWSLEGWRQVLMVDLGRLIQVGQDETFTVNVDKPSV